MITVFGSINVDLVATSPKLPRPGETVSGTGFSMVAGGKGANQALAAARASQPVRMAGAVGRDDFAEPALAHLRQAGVDLSAVRTVEGATGTALILVGGDGENMIAVVPGANGTMNEVDVAVALADMGAGDLLMLQLEIPADAVGMSLRHARLRGIRTILNIAPLLPETQQLAALADIVVANETEFECLAGQAMVSLEEREAVLRRLHAANPRTIVVTLGGDGAIAIDDAGIVHRVESLSIVPLDTVGAGDTFCGYLAAGLARGDGLAEAMRDAAIAGSLACLQRGAQEAIPVRPEVEAARNSQIADRDRR